MYKKYIKILENKHDHANYIKITFEYDLGGMNYFTGRSEQRGYYITVVPVERDGYMESFTAFTGAKQCILTCSRKSAKAEKEAIEKAPAYEKMMVEYIANKYGYILEEA